jgi:anti-anti-sigma factor
MRSLITETIDDGCLVLHLDGEFDLSTRAAVNASCRRMAGRPAARTTVLDLTAVTFVDCGTIRRLAQLGRCRRDLGDTCTMVVSSPFQRRIIELTGYSRWVPVVLSSDRPDASRTAAG